MRSSPLVVIERNFQDRLQQLLVEYVENMEHEFLSLYRSPEIAYREFSSYLLTSLQRIQKRLGYEHWKKLDQAMRNALQNRSTCGDLHSHLQWLEPLLLRYYDPMYRSQLENRKEYIVFRGSYSECKSYLSCQVKTDS